MNCLTSTLALLAFSAGLAGACGAAPPPEKAVQGLYSGIAADGPMLGRKLEARVVATGRGAYKIFPMFLGSLREKVRAAKGELDGKTEGDQVRFAGKVDGALWTLAWTPGDGDSGTLRGTYGTYGTIELRRVTSPLPQNPPPPGAVVLLDGKHFDELTRARRGSGTEQPWKPVEGGGIEVPKGGMNSKRSFAGSFRLHVEFFLPLMPEARGQGRANSGVYLPNGDEIQVLDSFGMTTYKGGGCGGLYAYKDPDWFDHFSLASLPPLEWQSFDVEYHVDTKDGKPTGRPRVTVLHNGIKIHDNVQLNAGARAGTFHIQDHGNPVAYRNIWVLEEK